MTTTRSQLLPYDPFSEQDGLSMEEFRIFQKFLHRQSGIILSDSKRYLVQSRLSSILPKTGENSIGSLIRSLVNNRLPERVRTQIIDVMTTNETFWFRDRAQFQLLQDRLLAELSQQRFRTLRIWSAACSTGQEPYSIAISALEAVRIGTLRRANIRIVATDLSQKVLDDAQRATYSDLALTRGLPEEIKRRYFQACGNGWQLKSEVTALVKFQPFNLLKSYTVLGQFDLIFCRNVLIYFDQPTKRDILRRLAAALEPGGCLFLSSTESLPADIDGLMPVQRAGVRYYIRPQ